MESIASKYGKVKGTILITGETGTGKSYLAKRLYKEFCPAGKPFIKVNLACLSETLLESELFGHVKGAFTGASERKIGQLENVKDGAVFLDEIGELSLPAQKKLLQLLEEKEFSPVGSNIIRKFKGRIIAATNKDLLELVERGEFRKDLYYRLMVFNIHLEGISANKSLLHGLIFEFFDYYKALYSKSNLFMEGECLEFFKNYSWPGNIRELKNCLEYCVCMCDRVITLADLPNWISCSKPQSGYIFDYPLAYRDALDMFEERYINFVLRHYKGRLNHTAKSIGMSKTTLIAKMKRFGIDIWKIKSEGPFKSDTNDKLKLAG